MTTEPEATEPTETPEVDAPPAVVEEPVAPPPPPPARPARFYDSGRSRVAMFVVAAVVVFAGGFIAGHWIFERHDHDRHRPQFAARAERLLQGLQGRRDGQSRNGPQMGQAPGLQGLLPLLEQLLNNRNGSNSRGGTSAAPDDIQRQLQQLRQQVQQLQDQLKATPTPATPR